MKVDINEKCKEIGVDKAKFYYLRSPILGAYATVCLLIVGDRIVSRGISIRSILDNHHKVEGRGRSFSRAYDAYKNEKNNSVINLVNIMNRRNRILNKLFKFDSSDEIQNLVKNLNESGLNYKIKFIPVKNNEIEVLKREPYLNVEIPQYYPMVLLASIFPYKAYYMPTPTNSEIYISSK